MHQPLAKIIDPQRAQVITQGHELEQVQVRGDRPLLLAPSANLADWSYLMPLLFAC